MSLSSWLLTSVRTMVGGTEPEAAVRAVSKAPYTSLLLGKHTFLFPTDVHCTDQTDFLQRVSLSSCSEEQFSCDDGSCVAMDRRCDKIINCPNDRWEVGGFSRSKMSFPPFQI